jgi:hypothetical protein
VRSIRVLDSVQISERQHIPGAILAFNDVLDIRAPGFFIIQV